MKKIRYIPYGYTMCEGQAEIACDEADVVRYIFDAYIKGASLKEIADDLTRRQISYTEKTCVWDKARIARIIDNDRYIGCNDYEPIVGKSTYEEAAAVKNAKQRNQIEKECEGIAIIRNKVKCGQCKYPIVKRTITASGKYSKYALTQVLKCGECGTAYRRVTWTSGGNRRIVWRCINRLDNGKRFCKESPTIPEAALHEAIVRAINRFSQENEATYMALMKATIGEALGWGRDSDEVDLLLRRIDALNDRMLTLVNETVQNGGDMEDCENEFKTISEQIEQLQQHVETIRRSQSQDTAYEKRLATIQKTIDQRQATRSAYDDTIVRQMIECIKVHNGGRLEVIFGGGYAVEEYIE